jgi:signal transduction histidine kinase
MVVLGLLPTGSRLPRLVWVNTSTFVEPRSRLAIPHNPLTVIISPLAWRSVLYCAISVVYGWITLLIGIFGFPLFPWVSDLTTQIERHRVALIGQTPLRAANTTPPSWRATLAGEGNGTFGVWAATGVFAVVNTVPGLALSWLVLGGFFAARSSLNLHTPGFEIFFSLGWIYLWLTIGLYVAWALAAAQTYLVQSTLRPYSELNQQVAELTNSRSELVELFEAERRRIERDLHDGAQQHLVVSTIHLGEAVYWLDQAQTGKTRAAVLAAQTSIEDALASLRNTIYGIHPQVLTDRGLVAAARELASRQPVSTGFIVTGNVRPLPRQIEGAAYYVTAEALTNVSRHSRGSQAQVRLDFDDRRLLIQVSDNGLGGARSVPGHGVSGLAERTRAAGGTFELTSPPGGPTLVSATFPYHQ